VNAGDAEQRTPLHYACGFNHLEIAKMLLEEGAKLESADSKGNTPLHYAAGYGRPLLVSEEKGCIKVLSDVHAAKTVCSFSCACWRG
jgi:hypothetical protein